MEGEGEEVSEPPTVPAELNLRDALTWAHHEGYKKAILMLRDTHPEAAQTLHLEWLRENPPALLYPERR